MKIMLAALLLAGCTTTIPPWLIGRDPIMTNVPAGSTIRVPGDRSYRVSADSTLVDDKQLMIFIRRVNRLHDEYERLMDVLDDTLRQRRQHDEPKGFDL